MISAELEQKLLILTQEPNILKVLDTYVNLSPDECVDLYDYGKHILANTKKDEKGVLHYVGGATAAGTAAVAGGTAAAVLGTTTTGGLLGTGLFAATVATPIGWVAAAAAAAGAAGYGIYKLATGESKESGKNQITDENRIKSKVAYARIINPYIFMGEIRNKAKEIALKAINKGAEEAKNFEFFFDSEYIKNEWAKEEPDLKDSIKLKHYAQESLDRIAIYY